MDGLPGDKTLYKTISRYGMHENYEYYRECDRRYRNKGLYTADQKMRDHARSTRQNNGGMCLCNLVAYEFIYCFQTSYPADTIFIWHLTVVFHVSYRLTKTLSYKTRL